MLADQHRGGRQHRYLRAAQRDGGGGAQRHLGLAEADITTHQPVHRLSGGKVVQRRGYGSGLVFGRGIGKADGEPLHAVLGRNIARRAREPDALDRAWSP
jgi:hypothetical protein